MPDWYSPKTIAGMCNSSAGARRSSTGATPSANAGRRWCRESQPIFGFDIFGFGFDHALDTAVFFAQMFGPPAGTIHGVFL